MDKGDKMLFKFIRKLRRFRFFHKDEYVFVTWAKIVTEVQANIKRANLILDMRDEYDDKWALKMESEFGRLTSSVKAWRRHRLFHPHNMENVDTVMRTLLLSVQEYVAMMLKYSELDLYKEMYHIMKSAKHDLAEEEYGSDVVLDEVPDEEVGPYQKIMFEMMDTYRDMYRTKVSIHIQLTNLENLLAEDLIELMMGLDVVHDRETSFIIDSKFRKPKYRFVEMDKSEFNYEGAD